MNNTVTPEHLRIAFALAGLSVTKKTAHLIATVYERVKALGDNFSVKDAAIIEEKNRLLFTNEDEK